MVLPLVVKDKVAAVIYADAGTAPGGTLDASGLQALTRFAAVWLELTALRKAGGAAAEDLPQLTAGSHGGHGRVAPAAAPFQKRTSCIRRHAALPSCWWRKLSCTINPRWMKAGSTRICTIA